MRWGCVSENHENFFSPLGVAALLSRTREYCPPAVKAPVSFCPKHNSLWHSMAANLAVLSHGGD